MLVKGLVVNKLVLFNYLLSLHLKTYRPQEYNLARVFIISLISALHTLIRKNYRLCHSTLNSVFKY
jgi:hypothetical protein